MRWMASRHPRESPSSIAGVSWSQDFDVKIGQTWQDTAKRRNCDLFVTCAGSTPLPPCAALQLVWSLPTTIILKRPRLSKCFSTVTVYQLCVVTLGWQPRPSTTSRNTAAAGLRFSASQPPITVRKYPQIWPKYAQICQNVTRFPSISVKISYLRPSTPRRRAPRAASPSRCYPKPAQIQPPNMLPHKYGQAWPNSFPQISQDV